MKLKLKLDKKTLLDFLLQNVEKIVFGVIALIFVSMLYSSLSTAGRFDKAPEQLQADVAKARRDIESTPPDPKLEVIDYVSQAKRSRVHIEEKPYVNSVTWDPPLFERRPLRDAPPLFTVQDLRGSAGMGAFHVAPAARQEQPERPARPERAGLDRLRQPPRAGAAPARAAGGEDIRGKRWIVITGLVPIEKQETAYADTFKQSLGYDPQNDYPKYWCYAVERVEVAGAADAAHPDWSKATKFVSTKEIEKWSASRDADIVAPEYLDNSLVFPLPPLVGRLWDTSVAHPDDIPVEKIGERGADPGGEMRRQASPRGPGDERVPRGLGRERGDREPPSDETPFDEAAPASKPRKEPTEVDDRSEEKEKRAPAYKLFRFFDFSVEPNKQYVYRVCLALRNPNDGMKPAFLKKPELAKDPYLKTKWSDPSPAIAVPRDTRVLLVSVKPPRPGGEPTGEVLITKWVEQTGAEAFIKESPIVRGQVLNFPDRTGKTIGATAPRQAETRRGPMRLEGLGDRPALIAPAGGGPTKENFNSDATAVDIRIGERHSGAKKSNTTVVGEILTLEADGSLTVHDELDELAACEQITTAAIEPPRRETRPTPGPGLRGLDMLEPKATPAKKKATKGR